MRYKLLGHSGVRVSELCLGTMTFGPDWGWGADEATSQAIFERFTAAGGNFIDTANNYTDGTSEKYVGTFIAPARDRYVVASKYTLRLNSGDTSNVNLGGNSRKSMVRSVEQSLRHLKTDYLDLLYVHMWDSTTSVEEILQGIQQLMTAGKILYFAFSDTPAWVVSYAIAKAEAHGWPRPVAMQVPYSLLNRSIERDVMPMCRHHDLAIMPWGILGGGSLTGKYSQNSAEPRRQDSIGDRERTAGEAVAALAAEIGRTPAQVALAWVRQQPGLVIPILGCRTIAQIEDNLGVLEFTLTAEQLERLDSVSDFQQGFPNAFLNSPMVRNLVFGDSFDLLDNHHLR